MWSIFAILVALRIWWILTMDMPSRTRAAVPPLGPGTSAHRARAPVTQSASWLIEDHPDEGTSMFGDEKDLASRLLDAGVEHLLRELTGDPFTEVVARDVDEFFAIADRLTLGELFDRALLRDQAQFAIEQLANTPNIRDVVGDLAQAIYDLSANEEFRLGDIIDRNGIQLLIRQVLSMDTMTDRALERLTESSIAATVASVFVNKIVGDVVDSNRRLAEKLPGMSSLLSIGDFAASRVRMATDRNLNQLLGDVAGIGAQYALRRTNNAIRELIRDAPLEEAALEIWDLHADEPVSGLRSYVTADEVGDMARIVYDLALANPNGDYLAAVLDQLVDVVFDRYSDRAVGPALRELGVEPDIVKNHTLSLAASVIEALERNGLLEKLIRDQLEPFFYSDNVLTILTNASAGSDRKAPRGPVAVE